MPQPDRSRYFALLGKHPLACSTTGVRYVGWRTVPSTYVYTTMDGLVGPRIQELGVENARKAALDSGFPVEPFSGPLGTFSLEAGHSPMVSKTSELAGILRRVAAEL